MEEDRHFIDVYVAKILENEVISSVFPPQRNQEINACANARVRIEKYCVWRLLSYAIQQSLGRAIEELHFFKRENGQWVCEECFFSLTHSNGAVAVAISDIPVGVDLEELKVPRRGSERRILTPKELEEYGHLPEEQRVEHLIRFWTKKESEFKRLGGKIFKPSAIEDTQTETRRMKIGEKEYVLSVSNEKLRALRIVEL